MPRNATVILRYGPYRQGNVVDYHEERLMGLQRSLNLAGHSVMLERVEDWNVMEIWVHGEKVYACDIQDLEFASDGYLDEHCARVVTAVTEAY